ncbi:MAG: transporter substrate-binding domain-containing protein [Anaerovoracaceae bacterium]
MKKRLIGFTITILMLFSILVPAIALGEDTDDKVRVGFYQYPYFQEVDEDGHYSGYSYDYLQAMAQYAGWEYEFVTTHTSNECLTLLEEGKIDLMGVLLKTPEREKIYDYPDYSSGISSSLLITSKKDLHYAYEDFQKFDGMTVGVQKKSARNQGLEDYCKKNKFTISTIEYETKESLQKALSSGAIDAALISSTQNSPEYRTIAQFNTQDVYFVTTKGNNEILEGLNDAIGKINTNSPNFTRSLYQKYYDFSEGQPAVLSQEELNYIAAHPTINILYETGRGPYEMVSESGKPCGISIDLMNLIAHTVGLKVNYTPVQNNKEKAEKIKTGKYDLLSTLSYDYAWANQNNMYVTQPFISSDYLTVYRKEPGENRRLALQEGTYISNFVQSTLSDNVTVTYYPSVEKCVEAVSRNEIDYTFVSSYEADFYGEFPKYRNLKFRTLQTDPCQLSMGVSKKADPLLFSIIEKAMNSVSTDEMADIIRGHVTHSTSYSFLDMIYSNPVEFTMIAGGIIGTLLLALLFFALYRVNRNKNKVLAEANEAKTEFLSGVSHDIRTPMNAIIGFTDMCLSEPLTQVEMKENLQKIRYSSSFLLGLINDVLDMSKIESGQFKLNKKKVFIEDFLNSILSTIQPVAKAKNITFTIDSKKISGKYVIVDELRVQQIFINLLSNAVKFTPAGGKVEFIIENIWQKNGKARDRVTIRDNGIGMSPEFLSHLYEPFQQEQTSGFTSNTGTGLGLTIVNKLVSAMGGTISVISQLGKGTDFIIELEAESGYEDRTLAKELQISESTNQVDFSGKMILLVEDHPLNQQIVTRLLEKKGAEVIVAENGQIALDIFASTTNGYIDAILMDIRMPVMDGLTSTKAIRNFHRPDSKTVPIIAITANAFDKDVEQSIASGMNAHLAKPVEPEKLYALLSDVFQQ